MEVIDITDQAHMNIVAERIVIPYKVQHYKLTGISHDYSKEVAKILQLGMRMVEWKLFINRTRNDLSHHAIHTISKIRLKMTEACLLETRTKYDK